MSELALVTGASGFLGSWVCRKLLAAGYRVRALHRKTSDLVAIEDLPVERVIGDILEPDSLPAAMTGVQFVFHTAAQSDYWRNPEGVLRTAVEGTRNVCASALQAGVQRLVHTSSLSAMGIPEAGELLDESHAFNLRPERFIYGYAKLRAEQAAQEAHLQGLDLVITNPSIVLGPGDVNQISGSLVIEAVKGNTFLWVDGGLNYVHIEDAAEGHLLALLKGQPGQRYILGAENLTHREVFTELAQIVGGRPPWIKLPHALVPPSAALIDLLNRVIKLPLNGGQLRMSANYLYCDISKARQVLGYEPARSFKRAARETYAWYKHNGYL